MQSLEIIAYFVAKSREITLERDNLAASVQIKSETIAGLQKERDTLHENYSALADGNQLIRSSLAQMREANAELRMK